MKKTYLDFWVGLFVAIGLVALLFLSLKVGKLSSATFRSGYPLTLQFDNIGGLKPRAPVKSAGVVVGRVASIDFDNENYQAKVTLRIDAPYQFPQDTSATILTSGLLGEQYIGLTPGAEERMLQPNDKITMTQSAVVLENLISQFLYKKAAEGGKTSSPEEKQTEDSPPSSAASTVGQPTPSSPAVSTDVHAPLDKARAK